MNNVIRKSLTISRNKVLYYELRKMAQGSTEIKKDPEVLKSLKKRSEQLSKLSSDVFEKSEIPETPLIVTYSNNPKFPSK